MQNNKEQVNQPDHYNQGNIPCIDALQAASTEEEFKGFCRLSALKYLWRLGHKDNPITEGEKAKWYVQKLLDLEYTKSKKRADDLMAMAMAENEATYPAMTVEDPDPEPFYSFHHYPVKPIWIPQFQDGEFIWEAPGWYAYHSVGYADSITGPFKSREEAIAFLIPHDSVNNA